MGCLSRVAVVDGGGSSTSVHCVVDGAVVGVGGRQSEGHFQGGDESMVKCSNRFLLPGPDE